MVRVLFKFAKMPSGAVIVDTTSNNHPIYSELSPFVLPAPPAKNLENLWQFSKVYCPEHFSISGDRILPEWRKWRDIGFGSKRAIRYPMGKGRKPLFSYWKGERLDYVSARKQIYAPEYAKNVIQTDSYKILREQYSECCLHSKEMILLDYDAYDHRALGMTLQDVINEPRRKMGHAFVLMMLLTGEFEKCIA